MTCKRRVGPLVSRKMWLQDTLQRTRRGVDIVVSERFRHLIAELDRFDDRLMKVVVDIEDQRLHFF